MTAAHVACADLNKFAINSSICLKSPLKWETIAVRVKFLERKSVFLISILSTAEKGENKWSNGALNSKTIKNNDNSIQFELSIAEQLTFISFRFVLSRSTSPICHEMLLFSKRNRRRRQCKSKRHKQKTKSKSFAIVELANVKIQRIEIYRLVRAQARQQNKQNLLLPFHRLNAFSWAVNLMHSNRN